MSDPYQHWIDGAPTAGAGDRLGDVFDPATGEVARRVHYGDATDVDRAVAAARAAAPGWAATSVTARSRVMFSFRELLVRHEDELADVISREHGTAGSILGRNGSTKP